jgi:hypothetical protein
MVRKVSNFIAEREGSSCNNSDTAAKRVYVSRYCRYCGEVRYNTRTYTADIEQSDDSNSSKE